MTDPAKRSVDHDRQPRHDAEPRREVVLVTGGSSGIGAGLAGRLHARGQHVVLTGRDIGATRAVAARHPGMQALRLDVNDPASVAAAFGHVLDEHGHLDMLVNNAGVQRILDFTAEQPPSPEAIREEVDTNLIGLITVTATALPLLRRAPGRSRLVHIGSGLGLVPLVSAPVYSATKAAVHSFTISLRQQLAGTQVDVVEIVPPIVETGLHRDQSRRPPRAMPLEAFLDATMKGLDAGRPEIYVGLARILRYGARAAPGRFLRIVNRGAF